MNTKKHSNYISFPQILMNVWEMSVTVMLCAITLTAATSVLVTLGIAATDSHA